MKNSHAVALGAVAHLLLLSLLVFAGLEIGHRLADFLYYHVFKLSDPYSGPTTFRSVWTSLCSGLASGLLSGIYGRWTGLAYRYILYFLAYIGLAGVNVAFFVLVYRAFPFTFEFWVYETGGLLLAAATGVAVAEYLVSVGKSGASGVTFDSQAPRQ